MTSVCVCVVHCPLFVLVAYANNSTKKLKCLAFNGVVIVFQLELLFVYDPGFGAV